MNFFFFQEFYDTGKKVYCECEKNLNLLLSEWRTFCEAFFGQKKIETKFESFTFAIHEERNNTWATVVVNFEDIDGE